ncbi:MAG: hypothetical protein FWE22_07500 [Firmicutes bacterium]|nr:hypothetical protein [Bacillota bacterium]
MENEKTYFTQYCNALFELHNKRVDTENITDKDSAIISDLRKKAAEQSGLTENEIDLIYRCRRYRIFKKVNVFSYKAQSF